MSVLRRSTAPASELKTCYLEHDLPPVMAALHIRMRPTGVRKVKYLVDDRLDYATREQWPDHFQQFRFDGPLEFHVSGPQGRARYDQAPLQDTQQIQLAF